jgi:hypothetical protein
VTRARQRIKAALLPPPGPRRLPVGVGRGLRLHVDFAQHTGLYLGLYEIELNRHLRRLCPSGTSAFDVGGSFGYDALVLARLGGGPVLSFEADPAAAARLRANVALNDGIGRIDVMTGYVGCRDGMTRLDDVVASTFVPGVVKIDVDGGELDVLRGAASLLESAGPPVILETHSLELERQCGGFLDGLGYAVTVVQQRSVLRDHRPLDHNRWLVAERRRSTPLEQEVSVEHTPGPSV